MLDSTLRALSRLRAMQAGPLSQGLSPENAKACLHQAIRPLSKVSLESGLERAGTLPKSLSIVVPYGVFTTPIEWTALALAGGSRVYLKAPARDPALVRALAEVCADEGLEVTWGTSTTLPVADAIVAFGGDDTVESIRVSNPQAVFAGYGHRFSVAFVGGDPEAAARNLAIDVARYDSRGCMAPTAVFTTGDPHVLGTALSLAMTECEARWPRGQIDSALGPEWRRRMGLGRVMGQVWTGSQWAVTVLPATYFTPVAMPRMISIHSVQNAEEFDSFLAPWRRWLSTCGTDVEGHTPHGFHRICPLGWMQAPPFPRNHDGRPMLAGLNEA
jgi:hypothetical protein